jgi:hypothetical protein
MLIKVLALFLSALPIFFGIILLIVLLIKIFKKGLIKKTKIKIKTILIPWEISQEIKFWRKF